MVDGNSLWDEQITGGMIQKRIPDSKKIETYPDLPDNLYDALEKTVKVHSEKAAIVDDDGSSYSYENFLRLIDELAAYLHSKKGVKKGCHVGLMMHNSIEFCIAFLALVRLGAVTVPLPSKFRRAEVLSLARFADTELVLCEEEYRNWFEDIFSSEDIISVDKKECSTKKKSGFSKIYGNWESRKQDFLALQEVNCGAPQDPVIIMFTSGTTSRSKGVVLKNYNVMHAIETYRRILQICDRDVSVIATPIYHITGLVALLGLFLCTGGTLYIHRFFDAKRVIEEARQFGFTFIHASPTVFSLLLQEGEGTPEIKSLKSFACGSSNMAKEKMSRLHQWLPNVEFHTVYGLTETCSPAAIFPGDAAKSVYIGSSGLPIPGSRFKIVDENQQELPAGEVGEIAVSGSVVLDTYYKQKSDSLKDGWLYTGDLGYLSETRYLYVVDRKKDMINRGGEKIWCYDVENEIIGISGIQDAAVVGIPDELYGEVAAAMITLSPGSTMTGKDVEIYLRKRMAGYKVPVKWKVADALPQTVNGKIDKITIKKILMEE